MRWRGGDRRGKQRKREVIVVSVSRREEGKKEEMKECGKELRGERRGGRGEGKGGKVGVAQKGREVLRGEG